MVYFESCVYYDKITRRFKQLYYTDYSTFLYSFYIRCAKWHLYNKSILLIDDPTCFVLWVCTPRQNTFRRPYAPANYINPNYACGARPKKEILKENEIKSTLQSTMYHRLCLITLCFSLYLLPQKRPLALFGRSLWVGAPRNCGGAWTTTDCQQIHHLNCLKSKAKY